MKKFWEGLLTAICIVALIAMLPLVLVVVLICRLISGPKERKAYKLSRYFQDLGVRYRYDITNNPGYLFYNSAVKRGLPITYCCNANGPEYCVFHHVVYILPNQEYLDLDEESGSWEINDGSVCSNFTDAFSGKKAMLKDVPSNMPVKLMITRDRILRTKLSEVELPEDVYVVDRYDTAFGDEKALVDFPENLQEMYVLLQTMDDLCGQFEMRGNIIYWSAYDGIHMEISIEEDGGIISVKKGSRELASLLTEDYTVFRDVCAIGKRGHVLVLRTGIFGGDVLYMGPKEDCPYPENKKSLFGKIYYLEAK